DAARQSPPDAARSGRRQARLVRGQQGQDQGAGRSAFGVMAMAAEKIDCASGRQAEAPVLSRCGKDLQSGRMNRPGGLSYIRQCRTGLPACLSHTLSLKLVIAALVSAVCLFGASSDARLADAAKGMD